MDRIIVFERRIPPQWVKHWEWWKHVALVAMTEAADAAVKAANVEIIDYEPAGSGMSCILLRGDVGAVKAAVEAASEAASRIGEVVSTHIIPRPNEGIWAMKLGAKPKPRGKKPAGKTPDAGE